MAPSRSVQGEKFKKNQQQPRLPHFFQCNHLTGAYGECDIVEYEVRVLAGQDKVKRKPLHKIWRGWMKFAEIFGNFQMFLILTIVFWVLMLPIALIFKLFADPLSLKSSKGPRWTKRQSKGDVLESMKKQG